MKYKKRKFKNLKIIVAIIVAIMLIALVIELLPVMSQLSTKQGQIEFKEKIQNLGFLGFLMLFGLQMAQIILVILPGEPIEILAGMCYGAWGGAIFITFSVFITTTIIVYTVKKLGKKHLYNFFTKEKIQKIEKNKLLKKKKTVEITLFLLFLIPGTPKDLLVYIGGLLPIKTWRFIFIATFVRFPSVITSTFIGARILDGNFNMIWIIYGITFLITLMILIFINKKDKDKDISEILGINKREKDKNILEIK